jgi:hypothetical protein
MASEPLSLKPKSFTTIYDFKDKVLSDNFSSESFESWKFKAKTSNSATVDFKAKFAHDFTKDGLNVKLNDEVKIKFPFYENKFWAWFGKKNNDLKFHFDFGTKTF